MIAEYHPHTVQSSAVPLYMQGLGDDLGGFWDSAPAVIPEHVTVDVTPPIFQPTFPSTSPLFPTFDRFQPLLDQGFTHSEAEMITSASASGHINNAQFQSILNGNHSRDSVLNTIFGATAAILKAATPANRPDLGPGASPRVNTDPRASSRGGGTSFFTDEAIHGVPNWALVAAGGLIFVGMMGRR
jgi:hypothetical protein